MKFMGGNEDHEISVAQAWDDEGEDKPPENWRRRHDQRKKTRMGFKNVRDD